MRSTLLAQLLIHAGKGPLFINKVTNKKIAYLQHERPHSTVVELLLLYHKVPGSIPRDIFSFLFNTIKKWVDTLNKMMGHTIMGLVADTSHVVSALLICDQFDSSLVAPNDSNKIMTISNLICDH
jgi:hypothetical protein